MPMQIAKQVSMPETHANAQIKTVLQHARSAYGQLNVGVMMAPSSDRGAPLRSNAFLLKVLEDFGCCIYMSTFGRVRA